VPLGGFNVKTQLSGSRLPRHARVRLRLLFRRKSVRLVGLAGAAALAVGLVLVALQAHSPQPGEIARADADTGRDAAASESTRNETSPSREGTDFPVIEKAARLDIGQDGIPDPDAERWAAGNPGPDTEIARALEEQPATGTEETLADRSVSSTSSGNRADSILTSAIPTSDTGAAAEVAVAESEAEIAELEDRLADRDGEAFVVAAASDIAAQFGGDAPEGTVTSYVNLRAGPENDAEILQIVPENANVTLLDHCPNWCEVEHDGVRGFIYGSFVDRNGATAPLETEAAQ
jgi:hypothetical protein